MHQALPYRHTFCDQAAAGCNLMAALADQLVAELGADNPASAFLALDAAHYRRLSEDLLGVDPSRGVESAPPHLRLVRAD